MFSGFLTTDNFILNLESTEKYELFAELIENIVRHNPNVDRSEVLNAISEREEKQNTCIVKGVAVPHANVITVTKPCIVIGVSRAGIDYEVEKIGSENYKESFVHIVVMILFEPGNAELHLRILSELADLLNNSEFYKGMLKVSSEAEALEFIRHLEEKD